MSTRHVSYARQVFNVGPSMLLPCHSIHFGQLATGVIRLHSVSEDFDNG
jgi:hypothetical protein